MLPNKRPAPGVLERIVAAELRGDVASERDLAAADPRGAAYDGDRDDDVLEFTPMDGLTGGPLTAA